MIVSAVLDPEAFGEKGIVDNEAKKEAIAFLKGIVENGVIIDKTRANSLLDLVIIEADKLSTKFKTRILLLVTEIKKNWNRLVAEFGDLDGGLEGQPVEEHVVFLANELQADTIITRAGKEGSFTAFGISANRITPINDFTESTFEALRTSLKPEDTLNNLAPARINELIGRSVKYARVLEIFDYHMGASNSGAVSNFLPGIQHFVDIWESSCVMSLKNPAERSLVLYAASERPMTGGTRLCQDVDKALEDCICTRLNNVGATIQRQVKKDPGKKMHARGFVAKKRGYFLDPGFDALKKFPPDRDVVLAMNVALEKYFDACRQLPGL